MGSTESENNPYLGSLVILLSVISFIGNLLTLLLLYKNRDFWLENNARLFIGHLAVLDLIHSFFIYVPGHGLVDKNFTSREAMCKLVAYGTLFLSPLYYGSLALLSVNRYQAIKASGNRHGPFYKCFTAWYSIIALWLVAFTLAVVIYFGNLGVPVYYPSQASCYLNGLPVIILLASFGLIQYGIIIFSYIQIFLLIRSQNRQIMPQMVINNNAQRMLRKRMRKTAKMAFVVTLTLFITNIPFAVASVLYHLKVSGLVWSRVAFVIYLTNFANNFVFYGVMDKAYREKVKQIFRW